MNGGRGPLDGPETLSGRLTGRGMPGIVTMPPVDDVRPLAPEVCRFRAGMGGGDPS